MSSGELVARLAAPGQLIRRERGQVRLPALPAESGPTRGRLAEHQTPKPLASAPTADGIDVSVQYHGDVVEAGGLLYTQQAIEGGSQAMLTTCASRLWTPLGDRRKSKSNRACNSAMTLPPTSRRLIPDLRNTGSALRACAPPSADTIRERRTHHSTRNEAVNKKLRSLVAHPAAAMNDVFLVISEARNGDRSVRPVLAGDEDQARLAHLEHYPDEQIVTVNAQG